jgi:hypothetical protein
MNRIRFEGTLSARDPCVAGTPVIAERSSIGEGEEAGRREGKAGNFLRVQGSGFRNRSTIEISSPR